MIGLRCYQTYLSANLIQYLNNDTHRERGQRERGGGRGGQAAMEMLAYKK